MEAESIETTILAYKSGLLVVPDSKSIRPDDLSLDLSDLSRSGETEVLSKQDDRPFAKRQEGVRLCQSIMMDVVFPFSKTLDLLRLQRWHRY